MIRTAARMLLVAGALAFAYVVYVAADTTAYQLIAWWQLDHAEAHVSTAPPVDGEAIGQMEIPRLGLSAVVAEGDSSTVLRRAVGHLPETALPGRTGNVVLAGHRDTFFRPLQHVRTGDAITLRTRDGDFAYVVESMTVVGPSDVQVLLPTGGHTLTLITCYPFAFLGSAPDRFIVRARESEKEKT